MGMIDITGKSVVLRQAFASGRIELSLGTIKKLRKKILRRVIL